MVINDYSDAQEQYSNGSPQTQGRNQNPLSLRYHQAKSVSVNKTTITSNFLKKSFYDYEQRMQREADWILHQQSSHKNAYNSYIRMMGHVRRSHEEGRGNRVSEEFESNIKKRLEEMRASGCLQRQPEKKPIVGHVKRGRSFHLYLGPGKSNVSIIQLRREKKEIEDKVKKSNEKKKATPRTKESEEDPSKYEIDKVYQVEVPIGKVVYKKIIITNTTKTKAQFGFKTSHPFEVQIVNQPNPLVELDPRRSTKLLLKFQPLDQEEKKSYVIVVTADGRKFLNILMSVNYKQPAQIQEVQQPRFLANSNQTQKGFVL